MKLSNYALTSFLLLFSACQGDDEQFSVSLVFGEWVDGSDLKTLVLSKDYTYRRTEVTKYGYRGCNGDWEYHDEQIVFVTTDPKLVGVSFPGDTMFVKSTLLGIPSNVAKVLTADQKKLTLQYFLQYPYPGGNPIEDTTIFYTRKE
ncbi:MAG: hypothetical protein WA960_02705 [Tunicatimonas sp.]